MVQVEIETWATLRDEIKVRPTNTVFILKGSDFSIHLEEDIQIGEGKTFVIHGNNAVVDGGSLARFFELQVESSLTLVGPLTLANGDKTSNGGAIRLNEGSQLMMNSVTFSGNRVPGGYQGGAIFATKASVQIENCTFKGNSAGMGGAISLSEESKAVVKFSSFTANSAAGTGGGIAVTNSHATITMASFSSNSAHKKGGALALLEGSSTKSTEVLFEHNSAKEGEGPDVFADEQSGPKAMFEGCSHGTGGQLVSTTDFFGFTHPTRLTKTLSASGVRTAYSSPPEVLPGPCSPLALALPLVGSGGHRTISSAIQQSSGGAASTEDVNSNSININSKTTGEIQQSGSGAVGVAKINIVNLGPSTADVNSVSISNSISNSNSSVWFHGALIIVSVAVFYYVWTLLLHNHFFRSDLGGWCHRISNLLSFKNKNNQKHKYATVDGRHDEGSVQEQGMPNGGGGAGSNKRRQHACAGTTLSHGGSLLSSSSSSLQGSWRMDSDQAPAYAAETTNFLATKATATTSVMATRKDENV
jgi:predicted outer membrane repeat protein